MMGPPIYPPADREPPTSYGNGRTDSQHFRGGYGQYHNQQWTLPPAYSQSGALLSLPTDPGLWANTIARWETITINVLNEKTWADNKSKLMFVENLLGEQEKLMWQQ